MFRHGSSVARRSVSEGRIAKDKAKKRASIGTGVIGSQVYISGAPVTTLRNLLDEVEAEVSIIGPPAKSVYETPVRRRSSLDASDISFVSSLSREGERHWVKDDWKLLDACFTDERFVVGGNLRIGGDGLADVDVIDLGHVVDRYIGILGGGDLVKRFGPGWERYCARFIDISIINISLQACNSTTRKSTSEEATFWHCCSPYYSFVVADFELGHEHHSGYSGLHSCCSTWNVQTDDAPCAAGTNCGQCPLPGLI